MPLARGLIRTRGVKRATYSIRPTEEVGARIMEIRKAEPDAVLSDILSQLLEWGLEEYDRRAAEVKGKKVK